MTERAGTNQVNGAVGLVRQVSAGSLTLAVFAMLGAGAVVVVIWLGGSRYAATAAFTSLFIATFVVSLRQRDCFFAFYYATLFVYTFFTQVAIIQFPRDVTLRGPGVSVGTDLFSRYMIFVTLSFAATWALRQPLRRFSHRSLFRIAASRLELSFSRGLFIVAVLTHLGLTMLLLSSAYGSLSYQNQEPLKGSSILFGLYVLLVVTFLALVSQALDSRGAWRLLCAGLGFACSIVFYVISVRAGQRIEGVALLVGVAALLLQRSRDQRVSRRVRDLSILSVALVVGFLFLLNVRGTRDSQLSPAEFAEAAAGGSGDLLGEWAAWKGIVFQDYFAPSLMLAVSMDGDVVIPGEVFRSSLANLIPMSDYPSLGEQLSRYAAPSSSQGFGYYIAAEGFNMMGDWGFLYSALVINLGLALWQRIASSGDLAYRRYMTSVAAALAIYVVRGQSNVFISQALFALLPAIVLFGLANGVTLRRQGSRIGGLSARGLGDVPSTRTNYGTDPTIG